MGYVIAPRNGVDLPPSIKGHVDTGARGGRRGRRSIYHLACRWILFSLRYCSPGSAPRSSDGKRLTVTSVKVTGPNSTDFVENDNREAYPDTCLLPNLRYI